MNWDYSALMELFSDTYKGKWLLEGHWGIEREAQRVQASGELALTPHPPTLGDKLTNSMITTDFSESQLELVTPAFDEIEKAYDSLYSIQAEAEAGIGDELLWSLSMPPKLPEEEHIPIAYFGETPEGKEKEIYRRGLSVRYGKKMQMISGIHYNFSFSQSMIDYLYEMFAEGQSKVEFINNMYFSLARNASRYRWLLIYLFGASPTIDSSYHSVICKELDVIKKEFPDCYKLIEDFERYAISLRVSRYGYSSTNQQQQANTFNSLDEYIGNIKQLLEQKSEQYAALGIYKDGEQIQLNDRVLQKENEFYSVIRMKQRIDPQERQIDALQARGVEYIEIRVLDIDPYEKLGIGMEQLYFMQIFMLFCLFEESPMIDDAEMEYINQNHHLVAMLGRKPGLTLVDHDGQSVVLKDWAANICAKMSEIAKLMDRYNSEGRYQGIIDYQQHKIEQIALLPSERMYSETRAYKQTYLQYGINRSVENLGGYRDAEKARTV